MKPPIFVILAANLVTGCDLAPAYHPPVISVPVSYQQRSQWSVANPADAMPRGAWWQIYQDDLLNHLEARLLGSNPDLAEAQARYDGARSLVAQARAGLFPQIDAGAHVLANRQSAERPLRSAHQPNEYQDNAISAQATYELDLWDQVANAVKARRNEAEASAADWQNLRLSLCAELATSYFTLRGDDATIAVLASTVQSYEQVMKLTQNRLAGNIASGIDVARAASQLDDARAQLADLEAGRGLTEHAIALLVGVTPAELSIAPRAIALDPPPISAGLPAGLLQRRPDVAAAEREMEAANAQIGVARAAFYPNLSLNLVLGLQSNGFRNFDLPDSFWSVGPGMILPLFEGGLRRAEERQAYAAYHATIASYRATVLRAFGDVEDALTLLHWLGEEQKFEDQSVVDTGHSLSMAMDLYQEGVIDFLDVQTAQSSALLAQRRAVDLRTRRMAASVSLIKALGGGWQASDLPKSK